MPGLAGGFVAGHLHLSGTGDEEPDRPSRGRLAAGGAFVAALAVVSALGYCDAAGRRARARAGNLCAEFESGRAARDFIARAAALGAESFSIEGSDGRSRSLERRRDFETRRSAFEAEFAGLRDGAADAAFVGAPPFERWDCRIEFRGGVVVSTRRRLID